MRARDIMTAPAVTVTTNASVSRAAEILAERGFSALPVIDHAGKLVGVVSEADLIRNRYAAAESPLGGGAGAASDLPAQTVGEVMTFPPACIDETASLGTIADTMLSGRRRSIPVVDGSRLVGVITRRDLVRVLARSDGQIALDIRRRLRVFGDPDRWTVEVTNGRATITDDAIERTDHALVQEAVQSVPGVRTVNLSR